MRGTVAALVGLVAVAASATLIFERRPVEMSSPRPAALVARPSPSLPGPPRARMAVASPGTGIQTVRSVLAIRTPLRYGDFRWDDAGVPPGSIWVRVGLRQQIMSVFRGGHEIGTAVILYGADKKPTPLGTFPILARLKDHRSEPYDAPMPFTLRLTGDGISIHGSNVRWGAATHGCIGVPLEFAALLFDQAHVGDKVTITDEAPPNSIG